MRLIYHDKIPVHLLDVDFFGPGEVVRANDDRVLLVKGVEVALLLYLVVESPGFEDRRRKEEFVRQLLVPLFAEVGRHDDEQVALALGPPLREEDAGFDGFAQADFVGENRAFGEWRAEGKK